MAINPQIPLMAQGVDLQQALLGGLRGASAIQSMQQAAAEAPLRQQLLQAQAEAAPLAIESQRLQNITAQQKLQVQGAALAAQRAIPFLQAGDMAGLKNFIQGTNLLDDEDRAATISRIDANDLQGLLGDISGTIGLAQQMGIFAAPKTTADTRTSIEKNLEAAGLTPGTPEFRAAVMQQLTKPSGTQVSIQMPSQKGLTAEAEALGKARAKEYEAIQTEALTASQQRDTLSQLRTLDTRTGFGQQTKADFAGVLNSLGLNGDQLLNTDVANVQAFNKLSGRLVAAGLAEQKGASTDADMRFFMRTLPSIQDDQRSSKFIIDSMSAQAERKIEKDQFYTNWLEQNNGSLTGAKKAWAEYIGKTPLWKDNVINPQTGLPANFYEWRDRFLELNPGATTEDAQTAWRSAGRGR